MEPLVLPPAKEEDRKRRLLQDQLREHPARGMRPAVARAVELLLDPDEARSAAASPLQFNLGPRQFELVHRGAFTPTGPGSAEIDRFALCRVADGAEMAGLVRKRIVRLDHNEEQHGWLYEALFYSGLAPHLQMAGLIIPRLYGCALDKGSITLVIEHLQATTNPAVTPWYQQMARAIGKLGAATGILKMHETEWLTPQRQGMTMDTLDRMEQLALRCLSGAGESQHILGLIEAFLGNPRLLAALRSNAYPCVAHGDIHSRNVIRMQGRQEAVGIIDWGKVCASIIGHDMALPFLSRYVVSRDWSHLGDFGAAAGIVHAAILEGVLAVDPGFEPRRVSLGFDLAIVQLTAIFAERFATSFNESLPPEEIRRRELRMAEVFRHAALIIDNLNARFG